MALNDEFLNVGINLCTDMLIGEVLSHFKSKKSRKRIWVRKWIERRQKFGFSNTFVKEIRSEDQNTFKNFFRMNPEKFNELLHRVETEISKQDTLFRDAIPAKMKLEVVIRYLVGGDSFGSLEAAFRVPKSTISKFLIPVLESISNALEEFIKVPNSEAHWIAISNGFASRWNFPRCCGAIDGKHVRIQCPPFSNSDFYNYKGFFSTVLFAMVDSNYKFIYVDIGRNGRINDSTIFHESELKRAMEDGSINFPKWGIIIGDDAFPLNTYLLKPYSHHGSLSVKERTFNYRLSRARRVVENAFGILSARFRIFLRPINLDPGKVDYVVRACCSLHNWLRETHTEIYCPRGCVDVEDIDNGVIIPGEWRKEVKGSELVGLPSTTSRNYTRIASELSNKYADYFVTTGAVDWQQRFI